VWPSGRSAVILDVASKKAKFRYFLESKPVALTTEEAISLESEYINEEFIHVSWSSDRV